MLCGNLRDILGTDTLYLGVALALLLGGDRDLDLDLRLTGERDRLLGERDLFLEALLYNHPLLYQYPSDTLTMHYPLLLQSTQYYLVWKNLQLNTEQ